MQFSLEDLERSKIAVLDATFVIYVILPTSVSKSKAEVGMILQFAKVQIDFRVLMPGSSGTT